MNAQQVSIKLFQAEGTTLDQEQLIPVFHRWIRENRLGDRLLIDVADYRHVQNGPGVMLVADQEHYGLDEGIGGGTGLLYSRKRDAMAPAAVRVKEALGELLLAAEALEQEPDLPGFGFRTDRLMIRICSRLAAENTAENFAAFETVLKDVLQPLYPDAELTLTHDSDPLRPLGVHVTSSQSPSIADLRSRL